MSDARLEHWHHYPMGPQLRQYLGISAGEYTGDRSSRPDEKTMAAFQDFLMQVVREKPVANQELYVDLIEELTSMGLPLVAVAITEQYPQFTIDTDFRACLALGSSLMMLGELDEAIVVMNQAKALAPQELAPYVNLASIAFSQEKDADALELIDSGLGIDPDNFRLWELIASIYLHEDRVTAGDRLRAKATEVNSYAGLSLAAEVIDPNDRLLKAELLEEAFNAGARDDDFLIEYTAALGLAQQFEKIPQLVYRLEHIEKKKVHWKLYAHAAQAFLALNKEAEAATLISKASRSPDIPANVLQDLQSVYDEQMQAHH
ncbi:tetratricopeptide repeat protein [Oligoflexus tunisiensis]|uniref:tetratricopeptide repeat protein n=1 Tax=Oligoflexus tunisiensis TaxID=708132 RepID=UPI00114CF444|nr:tetratricopeptide repeat protein [Oligoflexus tunisiensis]